eukprot:SAG22_NODE_6075_length_904_cov_1.460870_1_plen_86_part_00
MILKGISLSRKLDSSSKDTGMHAGRTFTSNGATMAATMAAAVGLSIVRLGDRAGGARQQQWQWRRRSGEPKNTMGLCSSPENPDS